MRRRDYVATLGLAATSGIAGCAGGDETASAGSGGGEVTESDAHTDDQHDETTASRDAPDGVYVPDHVTAMTMEGTERSGDFRFSVMLSAPETFHFVEGTEVTPSESLEQLNVHLMASVWAPSTNTVLPETGLSVEMLDQDGEAVTQEVIYPMLSQRMGFHYGSNVALPETGEYTARVSVGGVGIDRTRSFEGKFDDPASVEIPITFTEEKRQQFTESTPDNAREPGALSPMEMGDRPVGSLPAASEMPGMQLGTESSDDAVMVSGLLTESGIGGDQSYLYVSPRTPHNKFPLPSMELRVAISGSGTEDETELTRRLDPELGYHYGVGLAGGTAQTLLSGEAGVEIIPSLPPQVTRHAGYETAFIEMDPVTIANI